MRERAARRRAARAASLTVLALAFLQREKCAAHKRFGTRLSFRTSARRLPSIVLIFFFSLSLSRFAPSSLEQVLFHLSKPCFCNRSKSLREYTVPSLSSYSSSSSAAGVSTETTNPPPSTQRTCLDSTASFCRAEFCATASARRQCAARPETRSCSECRALACPGCAATAESAPGSF